MRNFRILFHTADDGIYASMSDINRIAIIFINMTTLELVRNITINGHTFNVGHSINILYYYDCMTYDYGGYTLIIPTDISLFVGFKGCIVIYDMELYFADEAVKHICNMRTFKYNTVITAIINEHLVVLTGPPIQKITYDGECYEANNVLFDQYLSKFISKFKQIPELRRFNIIKRLEDNIIPQHKIDEIERILDE